MPTKDNHSRCAIAIGSNLGEKQETVKAALVMLSAVTGIEVIAVSRWYETKAIAESTTAAGSKLTVALQPDYINGCAILRTSLPPLDLMKVLLNIEVQFGRQRRDRWDARTLDLDLLLYEDYVIDSPNLTVPHPRMGDRAFVLLPLAEIAPDWQHPIQGVSIAKLALNPPDIHLCSPIPIDL